MGPIMIPGRWPGLGNGCAVGAQALIGPRIQQPSPTGRVTEVLGTGGNIRFTTQADRLGYRIFAPSVHGP